MSKVPLSKTAREVIKEYGEMCHAFGRTRITIAGYTRHYFGDAGWQGDHCGCVDDRCIGFHHDGEDCECLPVWLDSCAAGR